MNHYIFMTESNSINSHRKHVFVTLQRFFIILFHFSLYRYQRPYVGSGEPGAPLSEPPRPVHQLHLRGRQPGVDVAPGREPRPQLPPAHPGGHRLRPHQPRGRAEDHLAQPPDHPWPNFV